MSKNRKEEPEYHFVATNIDYKINSESKKILAGNWCLLNSIKKTKNEKNIEFVPHIWENVDEREKDYIFIQKILDEYCDKLSLYLNIYNKENFPVNFWKILILPWLIYYLPSQLYKWRIINVALNKKKTFSFFSFPDHSINKYAIDTASYFNLLQDDEEFNYLHFKRILKYLKNKGHNILFIEKLYYKKKLENKKKFFPQKIKNNILKLIDDISLFFSKNNDIFIEQDVFGKKNLLKINFQLKQFPTYLIKLFNYHMERNEYEKCKFDMEKRIAVSFVKDIKIKENIDFIEYLNSSITEDIPICFLEGFLNLKNNVEKININPKLILSSYQYMHSEKFKFWVALKTLKNNSKFIVALHGGGYHAKFEPTFNFENRIVHKRIMWTTPTDKKEIQLPPAKLINFKTKRKYKYLSYVEHPAGLFPAQFTHNPFASMRNIENINKFNLILKKKILKNLIYLPGRDYLCSMNEVKNIINSNCIAKHYSLNKYLYKSKLVICSYPETNFNEAIVTGPTILISRFNDYPIHDQFQKIFNELIKYKIFFSNPEDACLHINKVWDNVDEWWYSKEVKNTVNDFIQQVSPISNNSINIWAKFLKNEIKKNI